MPSFVARVERPERGGAWIAYLRASASRPAGAGRRGSGSTARRAERRPAVRALLRASGTRSDLLAALLFEAATVPEEDARAAASAAVGATSARRCSPTSSAPAPTAATGPAAASRRCATASRWSPTTAPSATCSATGC